MRSTSLTLSLTLVLAALGCGHPGSDGELPSSDFVDTLERGVSFQPAAGTSVVRAEAAALRLGRISSLEFAIETGDIGVRADADGSLGIEALDLELDDISVPADVFPPDGIILTSVGVHLTAEASAAAEWTADGDRVDVALEVSLTLNWAILRDGRPVPLADVVVEDVPVFLAIEKRGSGQTLTLSADRSGAFWSWANTFELRDLIIDLDGNR